MADETLLVISTFPDAEIARRIAQQVVTERLAACANIVPAIESIYRWEGQVESATETLVFFKTTRFPDLEAKIRSLHPYKVPEIVSVRIAGGLPDYLRWVADSCG